MVVDVQKIVIGNSPQTAVKINKKIHENSTIFGAKSIALENSLDKQSFNMIVPQQIQPQQPKPTGMQLLQMNASKSLSKT